MTLRPRTNARRLPAALLKRAGTPNRPFSPASVGGLALWLSADSGVFQDAAGATPATQPGQPVALWRDRSGLGNDLTAPGGGPACPTFQTGLLNGLPGLRFDGNANRLQRVFPLAQPATFFLVVARHDWAHNVIDSAAVFDGSGRLTAGFQSVLTTGVYRTFAGANGGPENATSDLRSAPFLVTAVFDGPNSTLAFNDGTAYTGDPGAAPPGGVTLGGRGDGGAGSCTDCDLCELAVYSRRLAAGESAQVVHYFLTRWGLS